MVVSFSSRKKRKKEVELVREVREEEGIEMCREELFTPGSPFLMYCSFPARLLGRDFGGFSALSKGDSGVFWGLMGVKRELRMRGIR